jgi:hypothetical protein
MRDNFVWNNHWKIGSEIRHASIHTYRGADKSLARPGRKKLQRPNSKFCKPSKKFRMFSVQPGLRYSNGLRIRRKIATFQLFLQSGRAKDLSAPLYIHTEVHIEWAMLVESLVWVPTCRIGPRTSVWWPRCPVFILNYFITKCHLINKGKILSLNGNKHIGPWFCETTQCVGFCVHLLFACAGILKLLISPPPVAARNNFLVWCWTPWIQGYS